jgi:hypothetical protein
MKSRPVVEDFFMQTHKLRDGQTYITLLIVRFRILVKAPKIFNEFY